MSAFDIRHLGQTDYEKALALQESLVADKKAGRLDADILLVVEHSAVFTLGRRGGRENLVVSEDFLAKKGVPVIQTGRGGNITFHGPGQLVVYPIVDLVRAGVGVADFVHLLEGVMIRTAKSVGVDADRSGRNHGIWVGDRKLGSIGLSISRGITCHGLALNVNMDLTPFSWVNPCGLTGVAMTSLAAEIKAGSPPHTSTNTTEAENAPDMDTVTHILIRDLTAAWQSLATPRQSPRRSA